LTKTTRSNLVLGGLALLIVVLDQWTKALIRQAIPLNTSVMPVAWLAPYVQLTHIRNAGAAFGLGQGLGKFFVFAAFVAILLIVLYFRHLAAGSAFLRFALGLQLGGAVGNLIDRLTLGGVTDFVNLGWFPIFNVADSAITVGTILVGVFALFLDRPQPTEALVPDPPAEAVSGADLTDAGAR
jgi:signal peptidase II